MLINSLHGGTLRRIVILRVSFLVEPREGYCSVPFHAIFVYGPLQQLAPPISPTLCHAHLPRTLSHDLSVA